MGSAIGPKTIASTAAPRDNRESSAEKHQFQKSTSTTHRKYFEGCIGPDNGQTKSGEPIWKMASSAPSETMECKPD